MEPTSNQPYGASSSASTSYGATGSDFSTTAAHATGDSPYPTEGAAPSASGIQGVLDNALASGKDAVASGKKWLADSGLADQAQQLPQAAKDLGTKAWTRINGLTTTQKAVGIGLLAAGVALLATRGGKAKSDEGDYRRKPRRSPFSNKPFGEANDSYGQRQQWGGSRYGTAGSSRVSSGSGYAAGHSSDFGRDSAGQGRRRDQGPTSGSRYDSRTSGGQNPNNVDDLSSAF